MNDPTDITIYIAPGVSAAVLWFLRWAVLRWEKNEAAKREAEIRITDKQAMAYDRIVASINDHTSRDLEHHAEVKEAVIAHYSDVRSWLSKIEGKLEVWATPVEITEHPSQRIRNSRRVLTETK